MNLRLSYSLLFVLCGLSSLNAQAQVATEQPAVNTDSTPAPKPDGEGTTVVGDRESPIGLYITPWRNASPEAELDRPARFLEEQLLPIDADVFRRQIEYYNTITDHLRARGGNTATPLVVKSP